MKTLGEVLALCREHLEKQRCKQARREAEEIVSRALELSRLDLYVNFDRPLNEADLKRCRDYLRRRIEGEPIQYIHGHVDFFGCRFQVTPDALIPRPETELLADWVARHLETRGERQTVLFDICCGSGCLGLSLKQRFPHVEVVLADLCDRALGLAQQNAKRLGLDVEFLQGDLLAPLGERRADVIVCNPPYVSENEYHGLQREVLCEPKHALVSGPTGLELYQRLSTELPQALAAGGMAFLEIGSSQGAAASRLLGAHRWKRVRLERDWSGLDRFIFLEKE